jgi:hypothetical protein
MPLIGLNLLCIYMCVCVWLLEILPFSKNYVLVAGQIHITEDPSLPAWYRESTGKNAIAWRSAKDVIIKLLLHPGGNPSISDCIVFSQMLTAP